MTLKLRALKYYGCCTINVSTKVIDHCILLYSHQELHAIVLLLISTNKAAVILYFNREHQNKEQWLIILQYLKALKESVLLTIVYICTKTIVNFCAITEIPELSNYRYTIVI